MPWALGHDILVQRVGQHVERPHGPRVRFGRAGHRLQRAFEPAAQADQRRVRELERELRRKEKALAETAALLVLSKKLEAIFHTDADA